MLGLVRLVSRIFRRTEGFSLPEVAAVVAIAGTLAAIVVPVSIDQIQKGRISKAKGEVDAINSSVQAFFKDTSEWPDRQGDTADHYYILRSGVPELPNDALVQDEESIDPAAAGVGGAADPKVGNTNWGTLGEGTGRIDEMVNHLTLDAPNNPTTQSDDDAGLSSYVTKDVNWKGPYMPQMFHDPWGRNYLVFSKAFTVPKVTDGGIFGWVISAGPNETLETDVTSPILNNNPVTDKSTTADDIGVLIYQAKEGVAGVGK